MRLLVAEDDPGLRQVLVLGLRDNGYQVDAAERGDDAIDLLRFLRPSRSTARDLVHRVDRLELLRQQNLDRREGGGPQTQAGDRHETDEPDANAADRLCESRGNGGNGRRLGSGGSGPNAGHQRPIGPALTSAERPRIWPPRRARRV